MLARGSRRAAPRADTPFGLELPVAVTAVTAVDGGGAPRAGDHVARERTATSVAVQAARRVDLGDAQHLFERGEPGVGLTDGGGTQRLHAFSTRGRRDGAFVGGGH